jgi:hypothetical protein
VFSAGCSETERMVWFLANARDRELYLRAERELAAHDWKYVQAVRGRQNRSLGQTAPTGYHHRRRCSRDSVACARRCDRDQARPLLCEQAVVKRQRCCSIRGEATEGAARSDYRALRAPIADAFMPPYVPRHPG